MKCPTCQAKLLPVDGELFCLQCGTAVRATDDLKDGGPDIEETTDPLLQKAITDVVRRPVQFKLPVSGAVSSPPKGNHTFSSMRSILAASSPSVVASGGAATMKMPSQAVPEVVVPKEPVPVVPVPLPTARPMEHAKPKVVFRLDVIPLAWRWGAGIFGAFVLINVGLSSYFGSHVYPGVRVASVGVGGLTSSQAITQIAARLPLPSLTAVASGQRIRLDASQLGRADYAATVQDAMSAGKTTPLPIAAVIESYFSAPIEVQFDPNTQAIASAVRVAASQFDHPAVNAVAVEGPGGPVVIGDKPGLTLNQAGAAVSIEKAFGTSGDVHLPVSAVTPTIGSDAYSAEVSQAQTLAALSLSVTVKSTKYAASAATIGSWLAFQPPPHSLAVDQSRVAVFVSGIPGTFDRAGATKALLAALDSHSGVNFAASNKATSVPKLAGIPVTLPLATYRYCVSSGAATTVAASLADTTGWSMGGKLAFSRSESNCNVAINVVPATAMGSLSAKCAGQSTCVVGNAIELNATNWGKVPSGYSGSQSAYQSGMVQHAIGNWLGFEDSSCTSKSAAVPILAQPDFVLDGCSPNWYQIPAKQLGQVQPGF